MEISASDWRPVCDGVYTAVCQPAAMNAGLVVGSTGYALIDPGAHPDVARQLDAAARELAPGVELAAVIVTHEHWDHWFGASAFEGVTVIAHENVAEQPTGGNLKMLAELGLGAGHVPVISRRLSLGTFVDLGDRHLEVSYLGRAHTNTDVIVALTDGSAVFVGDLIEEGAPPCVDDSGSLDAWTAVLDLMSGIIAADAAVVPGHGAVVDKSFVFKQRNDLVSLCQEAEKRCRAGVQLADALAQGGWPWSDNVEHLVAAAYAELKERGVRPGLSMELHAKPAPGPASPGTHEHPAETTPPAP